jgi:hypothetical protein
LFKNINKVKIFVVIALSLFLLPSFLMPQEVPAPQNLMVTLTGYRNPDNVLKCKLYYMVTLPVDPSRIKNVHLILEKPTGDLERETLSDILIPFDWAKAQKVDGVVSFYTTRNILYIGIGEYDLLRRYECKISFLNENGEESRFAIFKKQ